MEKITIEEFHTRLKAQGMPRRDLAFKCPMCHTVQSMASLIVAGVKPEDVEKYIAFSCEGPVLGIQKQRGGSSGVVIGR